jgi:hypothetical protein
LGEQDVYYSYSTNGGTVWAPPINITPSRGKSAIMPWSVAGDAGLIDVVYYQANTGLNSNIAEVDANGNPCDPNDAFATCGGQANPSAWNVMFAASNNALNPGSNFTTPQITDHPMHRGQICTAGLNCDLEGGNRSLLDFFSVDVDHLGAAHVIWADDNNGLGIARPKFTRQLSGSSVFKNQNISLTSSWPITNHAVTDRAGDVFDAEGLPAASCPGMDVLGVSEKQANGLITVSLTLNGPPTAADAATCSTIGGTGGIWAAEFWASGDDGPHNFYVGYRDNPSDTPQQQAEGGTVEGINLLSTTVEFSPVTEGTLGGTCLSGPGVPAVSPTTRCTITVSVSESALGIKPGAGLYSITGVSTYVAGNGTLFRFDGENTEQADAATPFDDKGTGTTATAA